MKSQCLVILKATNKTIVNVSVPEKLVEINNQKAIAHLLSLWSIYLDQKEKGSDG